MRKDRAADSEWLNISTYNCTDEKDSKAYGSLRHDCCPDDLKTENRSSVSAYQLTASCSIVKGNPYPPVLIVR